MRRATACSQRSFGWGLPEGQLGQLTGKWRLGLSPWPPLPLPRLPRWPWEPPRGIYLPGDLGRSSRAGPVRAWECESRPAPTRGLGQGDDCPTPARGQGHSPRCVEDSSSSPHMRHVLLRSGNRLYVPTLAIKDHALTVLTHAFAWSSFDGTPLVDSSTPARRQWLRLVVQAHPVGVCDGDRGARGPHPLLIKVVWWAGWSCGCGMTWCEGEVGHDMRNLTRSVRGEGRGKVRGGGESGGRRARRPSCLR